jgi:hypothetical protein
LPGKTESESHATDSKEADGCILAALLAKARPTSLENRSPIVVKKRTRKKSRQHVVPHMSLILKFPSYCAIWTLDEIKQD